MTKSVVAANRMAQLRVSSNQRARLLGTADALHFEKRMICVFDLWLDRHSCGQGGHS